MTYEILFEVNFKLDFGPLFRVYWPTVDRYEDNFFIFDKTIKN